MGYTTHSISCIYRSFFHTTCILWFETITMCLFNTLDKKNCFKLKAANFIDRKPQVLF